MRESLTVLTGLVIVILSIALIAPYFIDWSAQRGFVEAQLAEVLGRPVKIRGRIDLKILPTPYLALADVEIGTQAEKPDIKVDELQLEIALPALLHGEVDFVEARLVHPQLAVATEDGTLRLGPPLQHFAGPMRFERISVENGTLDLADPATGRSTSFQNISIGAEAVSLIGPFKAEGQFSFAGKPSTFRLATGDSSDDRLHFKLILDENTQHPRADLDADLVLAKTAPPQLSGALKLSGHSKGALALPWQLAGTLHGGFARAALSDIDLRLGDEDHGVDFGGTATVDFGPTLQGKVNLKAHDLDLDRLFGRADAGSMQKLAQALATFVQSNDLTHGALPVALDVSADTAILGGETVSGLSASLAAAGERSLAVTFEASGPGRAHLRISGAMETGDAAGFKGDVAARASDVALLRKWLVAGLPQSAAVFKTLSFDSFDLKGRANLSAVGFVGQNLTLRLDQSMLSGTVAYTQAVAREPARLFADLSAPQLDLDSVPDLADFSQRAKDVDLSLRLDARAVKIGRLAQTGLGQGGLATGQIRMKLEKTGKIAKLDELTVTDVGGADIHAHGQWDGQGGDFSGTLDSQRLEALATLVRRLVPGRISDLLVARAVDLAPVHLTLSARATKSQNGTITVNGFDFGGTAGGTTIVAKIGNDPQTPANLTLAAHLHAPDGLVMIRQLGLPALPLQGLGPGRLDIAAEGSLDKPFATKLSASLAGTQLGFDGNIDGGLAAPHVAGRLQLQSAGLTQILEATGVAFPDPALRLAADLKSDVDAGPGHIALANLVGHFAGSAIDGALTYDTAKNQIGGALKLDQLSFTSLAEIAFGTLLPPAPGVVWSNTKFAPAMLDPPPIAVSMSAKSFELWPQMVAREAKFDLDISGNRSGLKLSMLHASMQLDDGRLGGDLTLRRDGANAAASGHLQVAGYDLALSSLRGRLGADLDLAGTGDSPSALIAGLAGTGTLTFADLVLPRTDPGALQRVLQAVDNDALVLDADRIESTLSAELGQAALHLGTVRFDAGLAGGMLRLTPKPAAPIRLDTIAATLQGSLDFAHLTLTQRAILSLIALPKNWRGAPPEVTIEATGPLANPVRRIESGAFLDALAARAIARESARIQAQDFDIHEQAFFYNRLKSERLRAAERQKAEDEAKGAAAAAAEKATEKSEADKALAEKVKAEAIKAEGAKPAPKTEAPTAVTAKADPAQREAPQPDIPATARFSEPVPMPVARPTFPLPHKAPLSIVRRPARPTPLPDPLAAGPF